MKVCIISYHRAPYRDPVFTEVHRRGNVELSVLTMFPTDANHPYRGESEGDYSNTQLGRGYRILSRSRLHLGIVPALFHGKFDAVVVPGYIEATSILAILYCWVSRTPLIYTGDTIESTNRTPRKRLLSAILRRAAAAWVPGAAARALMEECGMKNDRIFEGAYCLDYAHLRHILDDRRLKRTDLRQSLNIAADDFVFLFVGRMIPERGIPHLVNAFAGVHANDAHTCLMLVGDGPVLDEVKRLVDAKGLSQVRIIPPTDFETLCDFYAAADAYVTAAITEPYSLALAEAAIAGLPIVTTDSVGAAADYVRRGTGTIVPARDPMALKNAMAELARDKNLARAMGKLGQELAGLRTVKWAADQLERAVFATIPSSVPGSFI
jgi:glycosyltransferase involved in cell wall biosynthesis